jgi:hypothetical protein
MNGKSTTSRASISTSVSVGTMFPLLLASALIFYMMGFILSIRNLPDINGNDVFFTAAGHVALRNAILPLVQKVRREKVVTNGGGPYAGGNSLTSMIQDSNKSEDRGFLKSRVQNTVENYTSNHPTTPLRKHGSDTTTVAVPKATWPVTIRDEVDNFETIIHPGDGKTEMSVPKFWSDPLMTRTGPLMSRETALKVGSYATESRDVNSRTIFVSIASYRDFQCKETLDSIFRRAKFPNRVRVGALLPITASDIIILQLLPFYYESYLQRFSLKCLP